jgi:orotidine-5'-phosphate decarboxylase
VPATDLARAPFAERVAGAVARCGPLVFGLDPSRSILEQWGLEDTADGLERFVDLVVPAAANGVGIVKPQSAFYERHGWRGTRALTRLLGECRNAGLVVLLDAKRGDIGSTNAAYADAYLGTGAPLEVDAITLTPYLGLAAMRPILDRAVAAHAGCFIVVRSSNDEGRQLQRSRDERGRPVEQQLLDEIAAENSAWTRAGTGPIGAVVAANHGVFEGVDLASMNGWFLVPGLGAQGATPDAVARVFSGCTHRVLPSASRSLLASGPDPERLRASLEALGAELSSVLRPNR